MAKKTSACINEFLDYLGTAKKRSAQTLRNYRFYLERFLEYEGTDIKPEDITGEVVHSYQKWLSRLADVHGTPLKKNTQNYHLIALRAFLKFLGRCGVQSAAPENIILTKLPERGVDILETAETDRILEAPMKLPEISRNERLIKYRDKALIELLFATGLRVSELAGLKRTDVNLKQNELTVPNKTAQGRVLPMPDTAKFWLKKYLDMRFDTNSFVFISHDNRTGSKKAARNDAPLTPRSIQRTVQRHAQSSGIRKPVTPHLLRHTFAAGLLRRGDDIEKVQNMLGHASAETTHIYERFSQRKRRATGTMAQSKLAKRRLTNRVF